MPARRQEKIGLWVVGACGGVGSTVALGLAALKRGLTANTGLVSALPAFQASGLVDPSRIVFGGHDVRGETLLDAVTSLRLRAGVFDEQVVRACAPDLRKMQKDIRIGTLSGSGPVIGKLVDHQLVPVDSTPASAVERLSADIRAFQETRRLDRVVVLHLASSEPPFALSSVHSEFGRLTRALSRRGKNALPSSSLYALAAIEAGCAFVNFTPSLGIRVPALRRRAIERGLPFMGDDGKTGETLVKSALAPMFAARHLEVLSWFGQNILGNRDGEVLRDPQTRASKLRSKDRTVASIVGGDPATQVSIEYVPSLDDWKVAWDFIHFRGFLNTRMSMQFTWQGCDSLLAAPLVIDLVRFTDLEMRAGRAGSMKHLGFFFKDPIDVEELDLHTQWQRLIRHVDQTSL